MLLPKKPSAQRGRTPETTRANRLSKFCHAEEREVLREHHPPGRGSGSSPTWRRLMTQTSKTEVEKESFPKFQISR